jgi:hypothetical protein
MPAIGKRDQALIADDHTERGGKPAAQTRKTC